MKKLKVIDVSRYQGYINWPKVKPEIDAAIIQCGYGSDIKSQDDIYWIRNVAECEKLGIPWSPYIFSYANTKTRAESEVRHMLRLLEGHKPTFKICYTDIEEVNCGSYAVENAKIFAKEMKKAGYIPGLYTYESYYNSFLKKYAGMPLWIAKYSSVAPKIGVEYDAWQYTSSGSVPGISGRVDLSHFYKDYAKAKAEKPGDYAEEVEKKPDVFYQVKTAHHGTGANVSGSGDASAGIANDAIVAIKIGVTEGTIRYRVHLLGKGWLPAVTGSSWTDHANGYAGDGHSTIDAIQAYYYSEGGRYAINYRVKLPDNVWLPYVQDTDFTNSDGKKTAGIFGIPFTALKMEIERV